MMEYAFVWGIVLLISMVALAVALVVAVAALAANEPTRKAARSTGLGLLLILVAPILWYMWIGVRAVPVAPPTSTSSESHIRQVALPIGSTIEDQKPTTPRIDLANSQIPSSPPGADASTRNPRPSWVDQPAQLQGNVYRLPVKSGLFVTRRECEKALEAKTAAAVNDYVDELIEPGASTKIAVGRDLMKSLRKDAFEETVTASVGPMQQLHALMEFDDAVRADLIQRYQAAIAADHLGRIAIVSGVVLGLLAVAFGYLKLDLLTAGQMRGRLRFAAVGAILLVATGAVVVQQVLQ
jgi:hypothetical protein